MFATHATRRGRPGQRVVTHDLAVVGAVLRVARAPDQRTRGACQMPPAALETTSSSFSRRWRAARRRRRRASRTALRVAGARVDDLRRAAVELHVTPSRHAHASSVPPRPDGQVKRRPRPAGRRPGTAARPPPAGRRATRARCGRGSARRRRRAARVDPDAPRQEADGADAVDDVRGGASVRDARSGAAARGPRPRSRRPAAGRDRDARCRGRFLAEVERAPNGPARAADDDPAGLAGRARSRCRRRRRRPPGTRSSPSSVVHGPAPERTRSAEEPPAASTSPGPRAADRPATSGGSAGTKTSARAGGAEPERNPDGGEQRLNTTCVPSQRIPHAVALRPCV